MAWNKEQHSTYSAGQGGTTIPLNRAGAIGQCNEMKIWNDRVAACRDALTILLRASLQYSNTSMARKHLGLSLTVCALFFALCSSIEAQEIGKTHRIGVLSPARPLAPSISTVVNLLSPALRDLGYIEGKNLVIERRFAHGNADRLPQFARELVQLKMDVIVAVSPTAINPAKNATARIPIVMGFGKDPVRDGLVTSLARPGGNITGVVVAPEDVLAGKRVELIKEAIPGARRIAILATDEPSSRLQVHEAEKIASALGVKLVIVELRSGEHNSAFAHMTAARSDALFVLASSILNSNQDKTIQLAAQHRLPAIYEWPENAEAGGLMAYGSNLGGLSRRVAYYIDKVLKGAKPAELPVEQPTNFELVVNLRTAKQIGITIPPNLLARADRIIR
jgi:putative ABC transport system substrate-binding protein